jgi:D-alanyl-D-alanine carboxypeptidase (penicillin-binding protein 5/6)
MNRSFLLVLATLIALPFSGHGGEATLPTAPKLQARSALLFDARTGRVLFRHNENDLMPVASTQKLLTALLVVERGGLDEKITIEHSDTLAAPTKLYLQTGEQYTRRSLLKALLIRSANDVAVALARDHSGSVEAFAEAMNQRMRELGGRVSHFVNPNGLPAENQVSTAREMAAVARAAYFNQDLREIMALTEYNFVRANGATTHLRNTNRVLRTNPHCNGMKTGYTRLSGHCLISSAAHNGRHVIAIVLGSNKAQVWGESDALLKFGLAHPGHDLRRTRVEVAPAPPPTAIISPTSDS